MQHKPSRYAALSQNPPNTRPTRTREQPPPNKKAHTTFFAAATTLEREKAIGAQALARPPKWVMFFEAYLFAVASAVNEVETSAVNFANLIHLCAGVMIADNARCL